MFLFQAVKVLILFSRSMLIVEVSDSQEPNKMTNSV